MEQETQAKPTHTKYVIFAVLFLMFYFILYALTFIGKFFADLPILNLFFPLSEWNSPMYWLLPIAGFFVIFFLISYIKKEFQTNFSERIFFPIFYFILSIFAFYLNLFFFYILSVPGRKLIICLWNCQEVINQINASGKAQEFFLMEFWPQFRTSAFFPFVLAGIFAWVTYYLMKQLQEKGFF